MEFKRRALRYADELLGFRSGVLEDRVNQKFRQIIEEYDIEMITERGPGRKHYDIYLRRYRALIEIKRVGEASSSGKHQVDEYVARLAEEAREMLPFEDNPPPFTGILTDGKVWHEWKYDAVSGNTISEEYRDHRFESSHSLLSKLCSLWDKAPYGKPAIPQDPTDVFNGWFDHLFGIYQEIDGARRSRTNTKLSLWLDMLRTSSMAPKRRAAQDHLFVSHTFLVSLARGVIHAVVHPNQVPNAKELLGDGFIAWVLESTKGQQWANDFLQEINAWDWTNRRGDVLRPLYEAFVEKTDRKDFGEYYTPDWLAELMVEEILDGEWCEGSNYEVHFGRV